MDMQENFEYVFVMSNVAMNKVILKIDHFKYSPNPRHSVVGIFISYNR